MSAQKSQWLTISITLAVASFSASAGISIYVWRKKLKTKKQKIQHLEASLKVALNKCNAERQGRIRAQQALRDALSKSDNGNLESTVTSTYPMAQIAVVKSCFSTRNGTPRQPLLVPLARASLTFDTSRVPQTSLEGLEGYSHCWIIYVFHLNTNMEKLWKNPSQSRLKAKVKVPRLNGERMGIFATRSPHRPCPIGLTVAKVDAVRGNTVLLSGVDLVDGTPVLDIKPYLPYCDSIEGATVPNWVQEENKLAVASVNFCEGFSSSLSACWSIVEKKSLYSSPDEFRSLISQVLSWDIRSLSQRKRPHKLVTNIETDDQKITFDESSKMESDKEDENGGELVVYSLSGDVVYHLILNGMKVSYRIDANNVFVEKVTPDFATMQNGDKTIE